MKLLVGRQPSIIYTTLELDKKEDSMDCQDKTTPEP